MGSTEPGGEDISVLQLNECRGVGGWEGGRGVDELFDDAGRACRCGEGGGGKGHEAEEDVKDIFHKSLQQK